MTEQNNKTQSDEELLMEKLRSILLKEERQKVQRLETIVETKKNLSEKVDPIIEEHIQRLKTEFPDHYKQVVDRIVEQKIKDSSEEILNTIYPVFGQMIKKYIALQFQLLRESIDQQIKNTFSTKGVIGNIKARLFGIKTSDVIISNINKPIISEVFVIERDSGLLKGSASAVSTIDQDVVAGMLTAIKAFVEDAFDGGQQNLGMIEYDTHRIFLQNFPNYYIAVAMSGSISTTEKSNLTDRLLAFADKEINNTLFASSEESFKHISEQLEIYFIGKEIQLLT